MSWTAHYFDPRLNRDAVTRAFGSKDDALLAACDLIRRKCIVRFVHGPDSEKDIEGADFLIFRPRVRKQLAWLAT